MINVIIADDSAFLRQVLKQELEDSGRVKVSGVAKNGKEAIDLVKRIKPDLLILDCEMPVMNGLECLRRITKECPLPVFMFSSLTSEGASVTIKALEYGAVDFFQKPARGVHGLPETIGLLIRKIETIVRRDRFRKMRGRGRVASVKKKIFPVKQIESKEIDFVALGASTGGVQAIREIIPKLPKDMKPIVWVQHMPPNFTKSLADRLDALSAMKVQEAKNGDLVEHGNCYLAPGGTQMRVVKKGNQIRLKVLGDEKISGHCPSCNVLFDSVADQFSSNVAGVILTGMGEDGASGLERMHEKGAFVIGQNEESCVVYGMPKAAYAKGAVDVEIDIKDIAVAIQKVGGC